MRSAESPTRARIRDVAIAMFAERGYAEASLRDIAREADVSAALILHHFGSKDGLRDACDAYVVDVFVSNKGHLAGTGAQEIIRASLADRERFMPLVDYMARMLTTAGPVSDSLFDEFLGGTRRLLEQQAAAGMLRPQDDMDVTVATMTMYSLAPVLLRHHLSRALGSDALDDEVLRRLTMPILELYTHGLYADDRLLEAARAALAHPVGPRSDKGENDPNQDPDPPHAAS
ncbi:TetR/AcrR family transcriptional regulator [Microbacterium koreense]|uniref:TetR/AcrR family transcriptional regulator n=1 Tax=Microbacterium koreense TaxID=323761 RepID=A0ABW2ZND6_9MICO